MHPAQIPLALRRGALAVVVPALLIAVALLCVRLWHGPFRDTLLDSWKVTFLSLFFTVTLAALLAWGLRTQLGVCALLLTVLLSISSLRNGWTLVSGPQRVWALAGLFLTLGELYFVTGAIRAIILARQLEKLGGAGAKLEQQLASAKCRKALTAAPYLRRSLLIARLLGIGAVVTSVVLLLTSGVLASSLGRYSGGADSGELLLVLAVGLFGAGGFVFSLALGWFAHCLSAEVRRFRLAAAYNALSRMLTIYRFFQVTAILVLIGSTLLSLGQLGNSSDGWGRLALHAVSDVVGVWITAVVARQFRQAKDDLYRFDPGPMWVGGERHADLGMVCGRIVAAVLLMAAVFGVTLAAGNQADQRVREQANLLPRAKEELAAGRAKEALAIMEQHLQAAPLSPEALMVRGDIYAVLRRGAEARRDAEALLALPGVRYDQRIYAYETLASVSEQTKDWAGAIDAMNHILAITPDGAAQHFRRARFEHQASDLAAARQDYETAVQVSPGYVAPLYYLGLLSDQAGDKDAALARWQQAEAALDNDRRDVAIHYYLLLGLCYEKRGLKTPALLCFVKLFSRDPKAQEESYPKEFGLDDNDRAAVKRLQATAVKVYPDYQKRELDYPVYLAAGQAVEGKAAYERRLREEPSDVSTLTALGWLLFHAGDCGGAARNFQQAADLPDNRKLPGARNRLQLAKAAAQWAGGEREAALETYADLVNDDELWREEGTLNRLNWLADELQPLQEARLALAARPPAARPYTFRSVREPYYQVSLAAGWKRLRNVGDDVDFAASRGNSNLLVSATNETLSQVYDEFQQAVHPTLPDEVWGSQPVTCTERIFETNGIAWTEIKGENANCRQHNLYCKRTGQVFMLILVEKALAGGEKSPIDAVLAGFHFDGVGPAASSPTPTPAAAPVPTPTPTPTPTRKSIKRSRP